MNTKSIIASTLLAPGALLAGDIYTEPMAPAPMPTYQDGGWFFGLGADYLIDGEEEFYNGHVGYDFGNGSSLFLESGWINQEENTPLGALDLDIVPITLNYKYEWKFNDKFGAYVGLGAGAANYDLEVTVPFRGDASDSEWNFTAQAFAGLVYEVTPSFEIYGGARYIYLDDAQLFGITSDSIDDVAVGAGLRFNF